MYFHNYKKSVDQLISYLNECFKSCIDKDSSLEIMMISHNIGIHHMIPFLPISSDFKGLRYLPNPIHFFSCPAQIKLLILDSVSGKHYLLSIAGGHIPLPLILSSPSLLQAIVPDWWLLRPIGEEGLGWAGQQIL